MLRIKDQDSIPEISIDFSTIYSRTGLYKSNLGYVVINGEWNIVPRDTGKPESFMYNMLFFKDGEPIQMSLEQAQSMKYRPIHELTLVSSTF